MKFKQIMVNQDSQTQKIPASEAQGMFPRIL